MAVESVNGNTAQSAVQSTQQSQTTAPKPVNVQEQVQKAQDVQKMTAEDMQAVVERLNEFMHSDQRNLSFSVDKELDEVVVQVMDTETQQVIRQYPSEEAIKLSKSIEGLMGLIFNDRA